MSDTIIVTDNPDSSQTLPPDSTPTQAEILGTMVGELKAQIESLPNQITIAVQAEINPKLQTIEEKQETLLAGLQTLTNLTEAVARLETLILAQQVEEAEELQEEEEAIAVEVEKLPEQPQPAPRGNNLLTKMFFGR